MSSPTAASSSALSSRSSWPGFSGGSKAVFPGVADIAAIMRYHDARTIGDPLSTWGVLEGNPTQQRIRHDAALLPLDFCINVTFRKAGPDAPVAILPEGPMTIPISRLPERHTE